MTTTRKIAWLKSKRWLVLPGIAGTWLACKGFALVLAAALFTTGAGGWLVAHGDHLATGILLVGVAVTAWLAKIGLFVRMR